MNEVLVGIYMHIPAWAVLLGALVAAALKAYRFRRRIMPNVYELLVAAIVLLLFGAVYGVFIAAPFLSVEARGGSIRLVLLVCLILSIWWDIDAIGEYRKWSSS